MSELFSKWSKLAMQPKQPRKSDFALPALLAGAVLAIESALALSPPSQTELCKVTGTVLDVGTAEGSDELMNRMTVPTVTLKIREVSRAGIRESGFIDCSALKPAQLYTFRNCDKYPFKPGKSIEGIAGRSRGGGPHCIDHIRELK